MDFIVQLFTVDSVAHSVFVFSLVAALGLVIGSIKVFGIRLGVAGVLFSGLLFGHYKISVNHEVLEFAREFGLILFVYTIGMQVGPGFLSSFKRDGMRLNLMAAFVVISGAVITVLLSIYAGIPLPAAVGLFSGATTNTPSLGAAQQALKTLPGITEEMIKMPGLGYAVAYPFGIIGIILTMLLVKWIFRVNLQKESEEFTQSHLSGKEGLISVNLNVQNPIINGMTIGEIPGLKDSGAVISRIMHNNKISVALEQTKIHTGDILHIVGSKEAIDEMQILIGAKSDINVREIKSHVTSRRVIVTKHDVLGKSIEELDVRNRYGVTVTRISRAEIEFPPTPNIYLNFADTLVVVGEEDALKKFAADVGDSPKALDHPFVIPVFVGIALGVLFGSWPVMIPGMPSAIKLGLAGGPLVVAIILSRIGRIGRLVWYMPISANFMLREVGIVLFLACVGLKSGDQFINTLVVGSGFYWMAWGAVITMLPLVIVGFFARIKYKTNYTTLCGLLAGSMTDPPALAFANSIASSGGPSVAYATVYPLVMLLRVVSGQIIVLLFMS